MILDHEDLRKKHDELTQAFKDKNRKLLQTQELYDKLKRKAMLGQRQDAAEDAVDSTLNATSAGLNGCGDNDPNYGPYQEQGTPYMQPRNTLHEQPRGAVSYQLPSTTQAQNGSWFRTAGAQCE